MSPEFDLAEAARAARARSAAVIAKARAPGAGRAEIEEALSLAAARRWVTRALELAGMGLSRTERQAALDAFGDELDRQLAADLAVLLDEGSRGRAPLR